MHIVFLGLSGFPYGQAAIQRQTLVARALAREGWTVTIVCPRSVHPEGTRIQRVGHEGPVRYVYVYQPFRVNSFILRNLQKLFAPFFEFFVLIRIHRKKNFSVAIVSNPNLFLTSIRYYLISKILRFKLTINLVEIYKDRKNTRKMKRMNDYFFNRYGLNFFDAYLPISREIIRYFGSFRTPHHYVPVIVDSESIRNASEFQLQEKSFLYCGSATYFTSIDFILEAFSLLDDKSVKLILVTDGSALEMQEITNAMSKRSIDSRVIIRKRITNDELYGLYKAADGLLLPLFDTIQDRARFPHKLAEYLSAGKIVLSNPIGETTLYLEHGKSAMFSPAGDPAAFSKNMQWVIEHSSESEMIGQQGKSIALETFDYKILGKGISVFFKELCT